MHKKHGPCSAAKKGVDPATIVWLHNGMSNKLAAWLNAEPKPMSRTAFADRIGVTPGYVSQLCGDNPPWPGREIAKRIGEVTGGDVTPNDLAGYVEAAE